MGNIGGHFKISAGADPHGISKFSLFYYTVEPVNSDHMLVNRGGRYRPVVAQYRSKVMLKAPVGSSGFIAYFSKISAKHCQILKPTLTIFSGSMHGLICLQFCYNVL